MIRLVAAVAGPRDAEAALAGGADALFLLAPDRLHATRAAVAGRAPLAAAGEGADISVSDWAGGSPRGAGRCFARLALGAEPPEAAVAERIAEAGFEGVVLVGATFGDVLRHLGTGALERLAEACRGARLPFGFAGALEAPDVPRLAVLGPDFLAFRRSLGGGDADGTLDPAAVRAMRAHLRREADAGGVAPSGGTDRVFVRDMVIAMEIGAYGSERGRLQTVRFSIEGEVAQPGRRPAAMADVYSYDIMMDAVRVLVARGHTELVETLAEDLAATLLLDPRLLAVTVRVEKLELGPAAVGIEIRRAR